jgi:hypothetical protein
MAVVAVEGFDLYNGTGAAGGLTTPGPTGWFSVNWFYGPGMTTGRFSGQSYTWANEGSQSGWQMPAAVGPNFSVGCAFRHSNLSVITNGTARAALLLTSGGSGNGMLGWRPNSDGSISVWRMTNSTTGTLLGTTAAGVLLSNVWHFIEFSGTLNTATGVVNMKVDGVTVLALTAQNTCGQAGSTTFDSIQLGSAGGIGNGWSVYFDDMYVLDTLASIGERRIETIRPSADTATKQWTPSSGTVNYSRVNDTTVNTATYVQSNTLNQTDLYDTVDLTGIPVSIDYVQITCFAQKSDAGARSIGIIGDVSGVQLQSPDKALTASLIKYAFGMSAKPGGGSWDASSVNSLKVGPKVTV